MKNIQTLFLALAAALISTAASAQALGGFGGFGQPDREMSANRYGQGNALRAGQAYEAEVVSLRAVTIKPSAGLGNQGAGAAVGGSLGALAASQIKGGQDRWLITSAIGALGALAGAAVAYSTSSPPSIPTGIPPSITTLCRPPISMPKPPPIPNKTRQPGGSRNEE